MSKIHEALKKAEIERGGQPEPRQIHRLEPEKASEMTIQASAPAAPAHPIEPLRSLETPVADARPEPTPQSSRSDCPLQSVPTSGRNESVWVDSPDAPGVEPLSSEALREHCPKMSWRPDPGSEMEEEALDSTISREEFRRLRSHLYEVRKKQPLRKLLICSALSGEGKTFISANLAQAMACRANESILVVDGDLRLSRLHRPLGASSGPGLSEYLQGDIDLFSVIQRGPTDNLFFVAGGTPRANPADLISNGRLEELFKRLATAFDWIVMDSPPALLVADASVLASLCDGVLLVVRVGVTPFDMARKALQMFRTKTLLGTVLNGSRPRTPYAEYYAKSPTTKKARHN